MARVVILTVIALVALIASAVVLLRPLAASPAVSVLIVTASAVSVLVVTVLIAAVVVAAAAVVSGGTRGLLVPCPVASPAAPWSAASLAAVLAVSAGPPPSIAPVAVSRIVAGTLDRQVLDGPGLRGLVVSQVVHGLLVRAHS